MTPTELATILRSMHGFPIVMGVILFATSLFLLYLQMRFARPDFVATLLTGGIGMVGAVIFDVLTPASTTLAITGWVIGCIVATAVAIEVIRVILRIKEWAAERHVGTGKA